jgi:hypothetical protein
LLLYNFFKKTIRQGIKKKLLENATIFTTFILPGHSAHATMMGHKLFSKNVN